MKENHCAVVNILGLGLMWKDNAIGYIARKY